MKPRIRAMSYDTPEALQRRAKLAVMAAGVAVQQMEDSGPPMNRWDEDPVSAGRLTDHNSTIMNSVQTRYTGSQGKADSWGFENVGQFFATVRAAAPDKEGAVGPQQMMAKQTLLNAALSTYGNEGVGADGGFAVPPDFRESIAQKVNADDSLMPLCDVMPISSWSIAVPKDETPPWEVTGSSAGIRAYWTKEAGASPQSKVVLESNTYKLQKLTALVPVTEELLEDAPAMGGYVTRRTGETFVQKMNGAIIAGSGSGEPLGILNSGCLVTQAKESSQVADTIHGLNLVKMWARMPPRWRSDAVWCVNPDAVPALMQAGLQIKSADGVTSVGGSLLFIPGNISGKPYDTLMGRPIQYLQDCPAVGEVGDIIFANFRQYALFQREGGIRSDASIHVWFDQGVTAFRFVLRVAGHPWWSQPLADKNGSTTRSAFIALEAR